MKWLLPLLLCSACAETKTELLEEERAACAAFVDRLNHLDCATPQDLSQCNRGSTDRSDEEIRTNAEQLRCSAEHMTCDAQGFQTTNGECDRVALAGE
jgi:hypothetical protein